MYVDINSQPEERDFNSVLTLRESAELCISKHPQTMYYRLPLPEDKAPEEKVKSMPPRSTPRNSWRECAARFSKSLPHFQTKKSHPFIELAYKKLILASFLRFERFRICIFLILSYSNTFMQTYSSIPVFRSPSNIKAPAPPGLLPFSNKNGAKTISLGAAHTYMAYTRASSPGGSAVRAREFLYPVQK